jgi:hypothetical protein
LHTEAKVLSLDYADADVLVSAVVPAAVHGRLVEFIDADAAKPQ